MTTQARETVGTRAQVLAWCLWDTGSSAFHAIMLTFVFTVYLTSSSFGSPEHTSAVLSAGMAIAGFFITLTAPLIGQRSDAPRSRSRFLGVNTVLLALFTGLAFFARPEPSFLIFGVAMIAIASIVAEFAEVSYNAMLPGLAGPGRSVRFPVGAGVPATWAASWRWRSCSSASSSPVFWGSPPRTPSITVLWPCSAPCGFWCSHCP